MSKGAHMMFNCWFCHGVLLSRMVKLVREETHEKEYECGCENCGAEFKVVISVVSINKVQGEKFEQIKNVSGR